MGDKRNVMGDKQNVMGDKGDVMGDKRNVMGDKGNVMGDKGDMMGDKGDVMGDKGKVMGDKGKVMGDKGNMMGDKGSSDQENANATAPASDRVSRVASLHDVLTGLDQFLGHGSELFDRDEGLRFGFGPESTEDFAEVQRVHALSVCVCVGGCE